MEFIDDGERVAFRKTMPGVRGGAAGGAGADVDVGHYGSRSCQRDFGNAGMHGVREGSACNDEDAAGLSGRIIFLGSSRYFLGDSPEPDAVAAFWIGRIAAPVGAALLLRHLLRTPQEPS